MSMMASMLRSISPMRASSAPVVLRALSSSSSSTLRRMFFSRAAPASIVLSSSAMRSRYMWIWLSRVFFSMSSW
jgi:hypothetical protein